MGHDWAEYQKYQQLLVDQLDEHKHHDKRPKRMSIKQNKMVITRVGDANVKGIPSPLE